MKDCHSSVLTITRLISDDCASLVCVQLAKMLELGKAVLTLSDVDAAPDTFRTRTENETNKRETVNSSFPGADRVCEGAVHFC